MGDPERLVPHRGAGVVDAVVEQERERVADERPLLEVGTAFDRDTGAFGEEAGDPEAAEGAEDEGVLGAGLDADAVHLDDVAPGDRPPDAGEEQDTTQVAERGVGHVGVAVEELELLGRLVIQLAEDRDCEETEEREVDEAVHEPGGAVAQEGLHVHAGPEVGDASLDVLLVGGPPVRCSPLVVLEPLEEEPPDVEEQHGQGHVEDDLERERDVREHLALHRAVVVPVEDLRCGEAADGQQREADTEEDGDA